MAKATLRPIILEERLKLPKNLPQKNVLKQLIIFYSNVSLIREGFRHQVKKGYNGAKSYTLLIAMEGEPMQSYVNPASVKVSLGDLPLAKDLAVVVENDQLVFTWNTENLDGANPYDQLMPMAYHASVDNPRVKEKINSTLRKSGTDSLTVHKGFAYHVYVAFTAADRSENSTSLY